MLCAVGDGQYKTEELSENHCSVFQLRLSYDRNTLSSSDTQDSIHSVEFQHFTWLDI